MPERHRILIVDDDASDRQAVVRALRRDAVAIDGIEAEAVEATSIAQARELLQREEFACVFLDHSLPDGTSLDLLMELRAQGFATPVVVLTGQRDEQAVAEVIRAGAIDYLPKERLHPDLVVRSLRASLKFLQAQREKERVLIELRARDRAIAAVSNGITIADPCQADCPLVYANQAFLSMTGYVEEEVLGRNCRFLQGPQTDPAAARVLREAIREERACQVLILNYRKDGSPFWNEVTISPVRDARGALTHFIGVQTDVTIRQKTEIAREAAALADRRTGAILESITDGFIALDREWHFTYVNDQAERLTSRKREDMLGRVLWDVYPDLAGTTFERQYRSAMEQGVTVSFEEYFPPRDAWYEVRVYPSPEGLSIFFQNVNARKRTEEILWRSQEDLRLAVDAARLGTFYCDWPLDKIIWNDACKEHFFLPPDAEVDFNLFYSLLHPDDREPTRLAIERALAERTEYDVEYRTLAADGRTRWINAVGRFYYGPQGTPIRFDGVTIDISARKANEEELRLRAERERFLAELAERARRLTDPEEVIVDAVRSLGGFLGASRCVFADIDLAADLCTVPLDYRADESLMSIAGTFPISAFGPYLIAQYAAGRTVAVEDVRAATEISPEYRSAYEVIGCRAFISAPVLHSARLVSVFGVHSAAPRRWQPEEVELVQTVVERTWLTVEVLRQDRELARAAQEQREAHERQAHILESITDAFFALDHQWRFTYINTQGERLLARTREDLLGKNVWEEFDALGTTFEREYRCAVDKGVSVTFEEYFPPLDTWFEVRAYPSSEGLSVFFQNVNERKRAEAERERMLAAERARAEREALLNRIGLALRQARDPEQVLETAVQELGKALGADRCYYASYDQNADTATVGPDWCSHGLRSLAGRYSMSAFTVNRDPAYKDGNTQVVADASHDPGALGLGLRALVRVPLVSGASMTALSAAMTGGPRAWAAEDVALVEAVATQTQTALEAALVSRKEHTIAQQLQDALQPSLPRRVLGLSIGSFTLPALKEASVGGDFYDVFPLDKELYALVIGDVSGKGLAAAQQLALIRNSLRTTLYLYRAPAQAVANLNAIVSAHDLLAGFVTAFVGVYDASTGEITYTSCGHEPVLIRRAGGVEELETTGPPLGVDERAVYGEQRVTLSSGDRMLLYTDGLSEAGPTRLQLLGTNGLKRLLEALPSAADADAEARALVEQVQRYAVHGFHDDVAVVLVRRE